LPFSSDLAEFSTLLLQAHFAQKHFNQNAVEVDRSIIQMTQYVNANFTFENSLRRILILECLAVDVSMLQFILCKFFKREKWIKLLEQLAQE
jgi:hypothetical protein